jgi:hypothetical protein
MLLLDERSDLRPFNDRGEDVTEPSAVRTTGCCCQSEPARVRILFQDPGLRLRSDVVRFIDDDQIRGR